MERGIIITKPKDKGDIADMLSLLLSNYGWSGVESDFASGARYALIWALGAISDVQLKKMLATGGNDDDS